MSHEHCKLKSKNRTPICICDTVLPMQNDAKRDDRKAKDRYLV